MLPSQLSFGQFPAFIGQNIQFGLVMVANAWGLMFFSFLYVGTGKRMVMQFTTHGQLKKALAPRYKHFKGQNEI